MSIDKSGKSGLCKGRGPKEGEKGEPPPKTGPSGSSWMVFKWVRDSREESNGGKACYSPEILQCTHHSKTTGKTQELSLQRR